MELGLIYIRMSPPPHHFINPAMVYTVVAKIQVCPWIEIWPSTWESWQTIYLQQASWEPQVCQEREKPSGVPGGINANTEGCELERPPPHLLKILLDPRSSTCCRFSSLPQFQVVMLTLHFLTSHSLQSAPPSTTYEIVLSGTGVFPFHLWTTLAWQNIPTFVSFCHFNQITNLYLL